MITITANDNELIEWEYEGYQQDYLQSLLNTSTFEGKVLDRLENEINDIKNMDKNNYDKILFTLYTNQLDRITSGLPYSQTDLTKHLRKLR